MPGNRQAFSTAMNAADRYRWDSQWAEAAQEYQRALAEFPDDAMTRTRRTCTWRIYTPRQGRGPVPKLPGRRLFSCLLATPSLMSVSQPITLGKKILPL